MKMEIGKFGTDQPHDLAQVSQSNQLSTLNAEWSMMDSHQTRRFPHRHNRDGSHDSICISCYSTVASVQDEADLAQHEQDHVCDMVFLDYASRSCRVPSQHSCEDFVEQP